MSTDNNLALFFKTNMSVKKILASLAPTIEEEYTEYSKIKYMDKLKEFNSVLRDDFLLMVELYPIINKDTIISFFDILDRKIDNFSYKNSIREFFVNNYSDISEKLIDDLNTNCMAYNIFGNNAVALHGVRTVNELLHICHSTLTNTEYLYENSEVLDKKENQEIYLEGKDSQFGREIFDSIPLDFKAGFAFVLSVSDDNVLMLSRDLGHATTLEITKNKDNTVSVSYYIPKICNIEMVKKLKGLEHLNIDRGVLGWATGYFQVPYPEFTKELNSFLASIPTDDDILENKKYY